jgi:hypothetical protein
MLVLSFASFSHLQTYDIAGLTQIQASCEVNPVTSKLYIHVRTNEITKPVRRMPKFVQISRSSKCEVISVILIKSEASYPSIPVTQRRGELKQIPIFDVASRGRRETAASDGFNPGGSGVRELWDRGVRDLS